MNPEEKMCALCNKNKAKDVFFCEECLSKENRDKNFSQRIQIIINYHIKRREPWHK